MLAPGGRLAVVTFHSLEDRIVKQFFAERSRARSRRARAMLPGEPAQRRVHLRLSGAQPVGPLGERNSQNPRARSAKLRVVDARRPPRSDSRRMVEARRLALEAERARKTEEGPLMVRFLNVIAVLALIGSAVYAYRIKYETIYLAEQVAKLRNQIQRERDRDRRAAGRMAALTGPTASRRWPTSISTSSN